MKHFLLLLLMAFSLYASEYALLQKISDGDTFSFKSSSLGEYKCRIYGIDTPEKFSGKKLEKDASKAHISFSAMQEVGTKATEYAHKVLMLGNKYKVDTFGEDQYKRMLCVIHLQNGITYNEAIVRDGYAVVYKNGKYTKDENLKQRFNQAQKEAMHNNSGLWKTHASIMKSMIE